MNKVLKKAIEKDLNSLVTKSLEARNKTAAKKAAKQIREAVKDIAKKF